LGLPLYLSSSIASGFIPSLNVIVGTLPAEAVNLLNHNSKPSPFSIINWALDALIRSLGVN